MKCNSLKKARKQKPWPRLLPDNGGVYLVPAFSGLGAPHWDMNRKASIDGLTFATQKNHIVRAALESIPYQIKDVIVAMESDTTISLQQLMVDGGISSNNFIIRFLADLLESLLSTLEFQMFLRWVRLTSPAYSKKFLATLITFQNQYHKTK